MYNNNDLLGAILPDWGSFSILDVDYSRLDGQVLHVEDTMKGFVKDLEILFGGDETEASSERIVQNIIAATDSLFSLSKLVQRVRVSSKLLTRAGSNLYEPS